MILVMSFIVSFTMIRCKSSVRTVSAFVPLSTRILPAHREKRTTNIKTIPIRATSVVQCSDRSQFIRLMASIEKELDVDQVVKAGRLHIVSYPHPALRAENVEVTKDELESGEIAKIAKEMFSLMYATAGVGLAAPQVGINKRLMVYNQSGDSKKWLDETIMINPRIVEFSAATDTENEGCLSLPDMRGMVERSKWIKIEAMSAKGKKMKKKLKGWEARIFQHELDHLNGVLFPDRMENELHKEVQPRMNQLITEFGDGGAL